MRQERGKHRKHCRNKTGKLCIHGASIGGPRLPCRTNCHQGPKISSRGRLVSEIISGNFSVRVVKTVRTLLRAVPLQRNTACSKDGNIMTMIPYYDDAMRQKARRKGGSNNMNVHPRHRGCWHQGTKIAGLRRSENTQVADDCAGYVQGRKQFRRWPGVRRGKT